MFLYWNISHSMNKLQAYIFFVIWRYLLYIGKGYERTITHRKAEKGLFEDDISATYWIHCRTSAPIRP